MPTWVKWGVGALVCLGTAAIIVFCPPVAAALGSIATPILGSVAGLVGTLCSVMTGATFKEAEGAVREVAYNQIHANREIDRSRIAQLESEVTDELQRSAEIRANIEAYRRTNQENQAVLAAVIQRISQEQQNHQQLLVFTNELARWAAVDPVLGADMAPRAENQSPAAYINQMLDQRDRMLTQVQEVMGRIRVRFFQTEPNQAEPNRGGMMPPMPRRY